MFTSAQTPVNIAFLNISEQRMRIGGSNPPLSANSSNRLRFNLFRNNNQGWHFLSQNNCQNNNADNGLVGTSFATARRLSNPFPSPFFCVATKRTARVTFSFW